MILSWYNKKVSIKRIAVSAVKNTGVAIASVAAYNSYLLQKRSLQSYTNFLAKIYGTGMCLMPLIKNKYNAVVRDMNVNAPAKNAGPILESVEAIWTDRDISEGIKILMQEPNVEDIYN